MAAILALEDAVGFPVLSRDESQGLARVDGAGALAAPSSPLGPFMGLARGPIPWRSFAPEAK